MTDQHYFAIRQNPEYHTKTTCPMCGLEFIVRYLDIYEGNNVPICDLCAWEKAPALANLLHLTEAIEGYERGGLPDHVREALKQRENDPARLKKELQGVLVSLDNLGGAASSLTKLVVDQITAALDSEDVKTMQQAKRLHGECRKQLVTLDDEIPF